MTRAGWVFCVLAACTASACDNSPLIDFEDDPSIEGITWRLVDLPGHDPAALAELRPGVTMELDDGRLAAFGGCNSIAGRYALRRGRLTFVGPLSATLINCADPIMNIERAFTAALTGTLAYREAGGRLMLTADGGAILTFARETAGLEGATWTVTGFNNGRQALVSPLEGTTLTLSFEKGTISGQSGCNRFRASYSSEGNRVRIGPLAVTRMECEGVMTQEREFLAALESAATWHVAGDVLEMFRADGERAIVAASR